MGSFKLGASFFFFWIANLCLVIAALTLIGLGAYIWDITEKVSFFNIGLVILGVIEIILAIVACYSKESKDRFSTISFFNFYE